jgi:hypothetical protein
MESISVNTRQRIINLYLEKNKDDFVLDETSQFKIVTTPLSAQPLFLRFLLQGIHVEAELGTYTEKHHHIYEAMLDSYTRCNSAYSLIERQLDMQLNRKLDHHYGVGEMLVGILIDIYSSRDGLSLDEIWGILSTIRRQTPTDEQKKTLIYLLTELTMVVDNHYCFSHEVILTLVYNKFISSQSNLIRAHLEMAKFFQQLPASSRKLICLPYHLQFAGIWSKVKNCLTDINNFQLWWTPEFRKDFLTFWASMTIAQDNIDRTDTDKLGVERPTFDIVDEYVKSLEEYRMAQKPPPSDEFIAAIVLNIADFLIEFATMGHEEAADVPSLVHPVCPSDDLKAIVEKVLKTSETTLITMGKNNRKNALRNHGISDDLFKNALAPFMNNVRSNPTAKSNEIVSTELPKVSIVTLAHNRKHLFKLAIYNFNTCDYPRNKVEWVVYDTSNDEEKVADMLPDEDEMCDLNIKYIYDNSQITIGESRNRACSKASNDIIVFMDDDDYYFPQSVSKRVNALINNSKNIVGTRFLASLDIHKVISYMNAPALYSSLGTSISPASICFYKTILNDSIKFDDENINECETLFNSLDLSLFKELGWEEIIVSISHKNNITNRNVPNSKPNGCHYGWSDKLLKFILERDD